jgi:hypothetical protein
MNRGSQTWKSVVTGAMLVACAALPQTLHAGEGGTSHILPGSNGTLIDVLPATPGWFFKPMYLNYKGSVSAQIPTAAGVVSNAHATANTFVLGGGYTFEPTVLGGAHYSVAAFLPYTSLDISADAQTPFGTIRRHNSVSGFGDLTLVPVMLAWKTGGDWQIDALVPIYAPTGDYQKGRLGNPGLNYWTFDPIVGLAYLNKKSGFNAMLHVGYGMNTENTDTRYQSGSVLHFDGAIQQILPVGSGFMTLGVEGFYFDQVTGDSGSGAVLGDFKGMTSGLGPALGYIQPLGTQSLAIELKWLAELDTKKRLEGDYIWLRAAYKF